MAKRFSVTQRFICCADILGFSSKMLSLSTEQKLSEYEQITDAVRSSCHSFQNYTTNPPNYAVKRTNFYWFSDTFLLFSRDIPLNSPPELIEDLLPTFLHSVRTLFLRFMYYGYPLRGGIDYGELIIDGVENVYLGEPIIRAFKMSEAHAWAGISITPELSTFIENLPDSFETIIEFEVPTKMATIQKLKVIDWPIDASIRNKSNPETYIKNQFLKGCSSLDHKVQRYLENTIHFLRARLNFLKGNHD